MQSTYAITGLVMLLGLAGCASGFPHGKQVDYDNLPGENDSAKGPGLLSGDHYDASDGGGTLLYSDKNPQKSVFGSVRSQRSNSDQGQSASNASGGSPSASGAGANGSFSDFKQFQEYEHFKNLPANSPEKQRFQTFQQWKEYKRWERQQKQQ
ncbi:hypothetical protein ACS8Y6_10825 [Salinisphaera sp. RV14]|uniref:hypothetical protein n=1 Tax=unclassified Salinisphaera TaxID=2649847 RepID=UPI003F848C1B